MRVQVGISVLDSFQLDAVPGIVMLDVIQPLAALPLKMLGTRLPRAASRDP